MLKNAKSVKKPAKANREKYLLAKYTMTLDDYDRLFKAQEGKCYICERTHTKDGKKVDLVVDHDHNTGKVRGLLCNMPCNYNLGWYQKRRERILSYLAK